MSRPSGFGQKGWREASVTADRSRVTSCSFLYRTLVRVVVGPEERAFDIHKELVCSKSAFFAAALREGVYPFLEGRTGRVLLPEQEASVFGHFVHWLYTGKLSGYCRARGSPSFRDLRAELAAKDEVFRRTRGLDALQGVQAARRALDRAAWEDAPPAHLVSLYILADVLQVSGLRDHILTFMVKAYLTQPRDAEHAWTSSYRSERLSEATLTLSRAYDRLPVAESGDRMRSFLVDLYVSESECLAQLGSDDILGTLNPAFLYRCLIETRRRRSLPDDQRGDLRDAATLCGYHLHDAGCSFTRERLRVLEHEAW